MPESISFKTEQEIPVIAQPLSMACWATVTTMLMSWRDQLSYSIETAMDITGEKYRKIYDDNTGLSPLDTADFSSASGMTIEYQKCESPDSILQYLENYGPVIVITDEDNSTNFCIHARIIKGIEGDGTPEDTVLKIIDPAGGLEYDELFTDFVSKYESMAEIPSYNIQLMHY